MVFSARFSNEKLECLQLVILESLSYNQTTMCLLVGPLILILNLEAAIRPRTPNLMSNLTLAISSTHMDSEVVF